MNDAPTPDDPMPPPPPPIAGTEPEVSLIVPAAAYGSVATCDTDAPTPIPVTAFEVAPAAPAQGPTAAGGPAESPRTIEEVRDLGRAVDELGKALGKRLDQLQTLFDREIRAESNREKVVDRLHAELQEYKGDLLMKVLRPVFIDLIQLHDDIGKMVDAQGEAEGDVARMTGLMRGFQQGIEDILYRQGVEPFHHDGDAFDPRRQRAVATVPTDDPAQNKAIAARHRKGFQAGDKIIRPEIVSVFALRK